MWFLVLYYFFPPSFFISSRIAINPPSSLSPPPSSSLSIFSFFFLDTAFLYILDSTPGRDGTGGVGCYGTASVEIREQYYGDDDGWQ